MFNRVISKIRCYSPNAKNTALRNYNNLYYIATREGVDIGPFSYDSRDSDNATYIKYIHERPRSHGLFGNVPGDTEDLNHICNKIKKISESQCIYRGILSLCEADAQNLGFMNKTAWRDYLTLTLPRISETLGIPAAEMQWVAAFHKEKGHPHVHYMLWCKNPDHVQDPFITIPQQHQCREYFSSKFFEEERIALVLEQTQARRNLVSLGKDNAQTNVQQLVADICNQPTYKTLHHINRDLLNDSSQELLKLVECLPKTGRCAYAYMPREVKKQIKQVIKIMLGKEELKEEYDFYLNYHEQLSETYSPTKKELQVAKQKAQEDLESRLGNKVLKAVWDLRKDKDLCRALALQKLPSYQYSVHENREDGLSKNAVSSLEETVKQGQGGPSEAYLLGRIFDDADSAYHNPNAALHYYEVAADKNDPNAQGILGSKYIWGSDIEQNEQIGREYLQSARQQGNEFAKCTEHAYNTYKKELVGYSAADLMSSLLTCLCHTNYTRSSYSLYGSGINTDKKALKEKDKMALIARAKKHPRKHTDSERKRIEHFH